MYNYMSQGYMESRRKGGKEGTRVLQMLKVEEDTGDFELQDMLKSDIICLY